MVFEMVENFTIFQFCFKYDFCHVMFSISLKMDDILEYYISPFELENDMIERDLQQETARNLWLRHELELEIGEVLTGDFFDGIKKNAILQAILPPDAMVDSGEEVYDDEEDRRLFEEGDEERSPFYSNSFYQPTLRLKNKKGSMNRLQRRLREAYEIPQTFLNVDRTPDPLNPIMVARRDPSFRPNPHLTLSTLASRSPISPKSPRSQREAWRANDDPANLARRGRPFVVYPKRKQLEMGPTVSSKKMKPKQKSKFFFKKGQGRSRRGKKRENNNNLQTMTATHPSTMSPTMSSPLSSSGDGGRGFFEEEDLKERDYPTLFTPQEINEQRNLLRYKTQAEKRKSQMVDRIENRGVVYRQSHN